MWKTAFLLQAIVFAPLALLTINPEWIAPFTDWIFPDDSQGRIFGVMSLFVSSLSALASYETVYSRVETIVHGCMVSFSIGAFILVHDTLMHDSPAAPHYVFSVIFVIAALFWIYTAFMGGRRVLGKSD
eukprot:c55167_g1_i1.p1 GENE.c55167_g1_i1~~c55167_g1_i1.p1  ORF type:complete len:144 (+),score=19.37 c55167_g1_i1:48-434(+)